MAQPGCFSMSDVQTNILLLLARHVLLLKGVVFRAHVEFLDRKCTLAPVSNQQRRDVGEAQNHNQEQRGFRAHARFVPNQSRVRVHLIESHKCAGGINSSVFQIAKMLNRRKALGGSAWANRQ